MTIKILVILPYWKKKEKNLLTILFNVVFVSIELLMSKKYRHIYDHTTGTFCTKPRQHTTKHYWNMLNKHSII